METTQEINLSDLKAAISLLSDHVSNAAKPSIEDQVNAEIKKKGGIRPKDFPIQTANCVTQDVSAWLSKIEPQIKTAEQSEMKNHAEWLFDLVSALIHERAQADSEISRWKSVADSMLVEWMKTTHGFKGVPMGRKMRLEAGQSMFDPKATGAAQ